MPHVCPLLVRPQEGVRLLGIRVTEVVRCCVGAGNGPTSYALRHLSSPEHLSVGDRFKGILFIFISSGKIETLAMVIIP